MKRFNLYALVAAGLLAMGAALGAHRPVMRWTVQLYLSNMFPGLVHVGSSQGGLLSALVLEDVRLHAPGEATPLVSVDRIATDFRLLGGGWRSMRCGVEGPKIYLEELVRAMGRITLPAAGPLILLPHGGIWRTARFEVANGSVHQSANRPDVILLDGVEGNAGPAGDVMELSFGTTAASLPGRTLSIVGTIPRSGRGSNLDFELMFDRLESLNAFLESTQFLTGTARAQGKIRAGRFEYVQAEMQEAVLRIVAEDRLLEGLRGKMVLNDRFLSLKECAWESRGLRMELSGDIQGITLSPGRIDAETVLAHLVFWSDGLSSKPLTMAVETSAKVYYRHPDTMEMLVQGDEVLGSLSLFSGTLGLNELLDMTYQARLVPGRPLLLDYEVQGLDWPALKERWFPEKLGDFFAPEAIRGKGHAECEWNSVLLLGALQWSGSELPYRLRWDQRKVQVEDFHLDAQTQLLGYLDLDSGKEHSLVLRFKDKSLTRLLMGLGKTKKPSMTGKMTGSLSIKGDLRDPEVEGDLELRRGTLKGIPFGQGTIHLSGRLPRLYLQDSRILMEGDRQILLKGYLDLSESNVLKNLYSEMPAPLPAGGLP